MDYPTERFIKNDLGFPSIFEFSKQSSISQQTFSTWKSRKRSIASLPITVLDEFSYFSDMSLSDIRLKLMQYELESTISELENTKEGSPMIDKEKETAINSFYDAGYKFGEALKSKDKRARSHLQKLFKDSPKSDVDPIDSFLEQYLKICITLNISAYSEMTALPSEGRVSLINTFIMGANNGISTKKD